MLRPGLPLKPHPRFSTPFITVQPHCTYLLIQSYSRVYFIKEKGFQCQVIHGDAQGVCQRILKSASWPMHMTQQGVKMKKKKLETFHNRLAAFGTVAAPRAAAPECQKGKIETTQSRHQRRGYLHKQFSIFYVTFFSPIFIVIL